MKSSIQKLFTANSFARGVAVLSTGTAGAQIILLLAAPILTRLYSPEDFGVLAVFVSIIAILSVIACLRFELAIPIAENDEIATHIVRLCLLILILIGSILTVIVFLLGDWFASLLNLGEAKIYLWILPVGVFLTGLYQVFSFWATRQKDFTKISKTKLKQAFFSVFTQVSLFKLGPLGLLIGYVVAKSAGVHELSRTSLSACRRAPYEKSDIWRTFKKYKQLPVYSTWTGLINSLGQQLPTIVLIAFYDPKVAGFYALANRVLAGPVSVVGGAISNVFFANSRDFYKSGQLKRVTTRIVLSLCLIGCLMFTPIYFFLPTFFEGIFGQGWHQAGLVTQAMVPYVFMTLITSPISNLFILLERNGVALVWQVVFFATRFCSLIYLVSNMEFLSALTIFFWISSSLRLVQLSLFYKLLNNAN